MDAVTRIRLPHGEVHELGPGDIIGRAWSATLQLHDPWVSEAHCMVSLREGLLKLLGLRGKLWLGDAAHNELALSPGMRVRLSSETELFVLDVRLPDRFNALEIPGVGRVPLVGPLSIVLNATALGRAAVTTGLRPDADLVAWTDGDAWFWRSKGGQALPLVPGETIALPDRVARVISASVYEAGLDPTDAGAARAHLDPPLHVVARFDCVHIHRDDQQPLVIDGMAGRILSDLAIAGVPVPWTALARELWPLIEDLATLRRNWDSAMARLRRKLRAGRLRADLVRADHAGNIELVLMRRDTVEDRT